jgi:UDP-glucose 4-epimerase
MATYVVTGATGFLGSAVIEAFRKRGDQLIVASRQRPPEHELDWLHFDLRDHGTFAALIEARPKGIVHLAWSSTPAIADRDVTADLATNVGGTVALLQHLADIPETVVVFASSGGTVYGPADTLPIPESHALRPISFYGRGKASAEHYGSLFRARDGLDFRVARISNPYGASQSQAKLQGAVPIFARKIIAGEEIVIWGDGGIVRDYLHVEDAAAGLLSVLDLQRQPAEHVPVYNLGSRIGTTLLELIELLGSILGTEPKIVFQPERSFDVRANILDTDKIKRDTGWGPAISLREGLTQTVQRLFDEMGRAR